MPKGGARKGAGRKVGSLSKKTQEIAQALSSDGGLTPLAYLCQVMRDEDNPKPMRVDAAKAAAPYMHPRLQITTLDMTADVSFKVVSEFA